MTVRRPFIVALEGIDGSGTTTQTARVAAALRQLGYSVHETRQPSDGPIGRFIRQILVGERVVSTSAMAPLFAADRADQAERERPDVDVIVSDRSYLSTLAYQGPVAERLVDGWRGLDPDLPILIDIDPDVAAERRAARGGRVELYEHTAMQTLAAQRYRQIWREYSTLCGQLNGNDTVEEITELIVGLVTSALERRDDQVGTQDFAHGQVAAMNGATQIGIVLPTCGCESEPHDCDDDQVGTIECEKCNGRGAISIWTSNQHSPVIDLKCHACNGTGQIGGAP